MSQMRVILRRESDEGYKRHESDEGYIASWVK